jgi:hypothetical protein
MLASLIGALASVEVPLTDQMIPWCPIFSDEETRSLAWKAVIEIAESVLKKDYLPIGHAILASSRHDEALLFTYLGRATGEERWLSEGLRSMSLALEDVSTLRTTVGLHSGLCGLGWIYSHLSAMGFEVSVKESGAAGVLATAGGPLDMEEELLAPVDEFLLNAMQQGIPKKYDLISGLVGVGVFFLEREPPDRFVAGISAVLQRLEKEAVWSDCGVAWPTRPPLLSRWFRDQSGTGIFNLGVAHGLPGVIYLLSRIVSENVERDRSSVLLEGALRWLLAHQNPPGSESSFPGYVPSELACVPDARCRRPMTTRLAWCYGDLGVAAVLLHVAGQLGRADLRETARKVLRGCIAREAASNCLEDISLCHGAAGVAHMYNRIYQSDGDTRYREAAIHWFRVALSMRKPGEGVGGVKSRLDGAEHPSPGFLTGGIGVALALLAALTPLEAGWDRRIALS